jgi:short-subunit dehydrogenase
MNNYFDLTGQVAVVTGCSTGLGVQMAKALANQGAKIIAIARRKELIDSVAKEIADTYKVEAIGIQCDITDTNRVNEVVDEILAKFGRIDILINNAGMFFFEELTTENEAKALTMMRLHVFTPTRLCVLFGEEMKKRGYGYIINMSSMAAKLPCPGITVYSATKAYLKSFSKSLYFEMRPYGVGVTTVCPAAIATPLYKLKPSLLKLGVKVGLIGTPQWLVCKALKGMMRKKRVVKPGLMNRYLPPLIAILPHRLVNTIWQRFK